jgi:ABC-type nickel/cobalt efflux system permease component RcnA
VTLGSLGFTADEAPAVVMGSIVFSIPFVALFVAYFAFLPAIPAILLSEILGKRDWLYHAISGAVVALVIVVAIRSAAEAGNQAITDTRFALALVGAGMCGGIAYWLVAGRMAGNWRARVRRPVAVDATQVE